MDALTRCSESLKQGAIPEPSEALRAYLLKGVMDSRTMLGRGGPPRPPAEGWRVRLWKRLAAIWKR